MKSTLCNKNNNTPYAQNSASVNLSLCSIGLFHDPNYAWQLLENQMLIELTQTPEGSDISNLLQLYMRGVQVMNSLLDPRESYFRNRVTALMAKNTVMKSFNKPKPVAVVETKTEIVTVVDKQIKKKDEKKQKVQKTDGLISTLGLQQKKKELQLRLAYASQQHNPEGLRKMLDQTKQSQIKITKKIETIMKSHQQSLNQRINRRKLKTATFKSRPQDQQETIAAIEPNSNSGSTNNSTPLKMTSFTVIPQIIQESPLKMSDRKLYKSMEGKQQRMRERRKSAGQLDLINV